MKIVIGSILVIIIIGFGVWLMLSPTFSRVGDTAEKLKKKIKEDKHGEDD